MATEKTTLKLTKRSENSTADEETQLDITPTKDTPDETTLTKEECDAQSLFFNAENSLCEPFLECDFVTEILDKVNNVCEIVPASIDECERQNKFYNAEAITCDQWTTCDSQFADLDRQTNLCTDKTPSKEICDAKSLFFDQASVQCTEFLQCNDD